MFESKNLAETAKYAQSLAPLLEKHRIVVLYGDLGSGKTTLSKALAQALNCTEKITSPTFALSHRHELPDDKKLWHWDLYRLSSTLEAEGLGFFDEINNPDTIHIIEWPDIILAHLPRPFLEIHCHHQSETSRTFEHKIHTTLLPTDEEIQKLREEYELPQNIIEHCEMVGQVGHLLATKLKEKGEHIEPELVRKAGLLHDLLRPIDFHPDKIEPDKKTLRNKLREKFGDIPHEPAACQLLTELGYPDLGYTIGEHRFDLLNDPSVLPLTLAGKLLNYADKRVKHMEIVSLDERFRDGRIRNAHLLSDNIDQIENQCFRLEKEIFGKLDIEPEDIADLL